MRWDSCRFLSKFGKSKSFAGEGARFSAPFYGRQRAETPRGARLAFARLLAAVSVYVSLPMVYDVFVSFCFCPFDAHCSIEFSVFTQTCVRTALPSKQFNHLAGSKATASAVHQNAGDMGISCTFPPS